MRSMDPRSHLKLVNLHIIDNLLLALIYCIHINLGLMKNTKTFCSHVDKFYAQTSGQRRLLFELQQCALSVFVYIFNVYIIDVSQCKPLVYNPLVWLPHSHCLTTQFLSPMCCLKGRGCFCPFCLLL